MSTALFVGNHASERLLLLLRGERIELPPADWDAIVDEAMRHHIAPLLFRQLTRVDRRVPDPDPERDRSRERRLPPTAPGSTTAVIPDAIRARLRDSYVRTRLRNALLLRELGVVLRTLEGQGVDTIVLKGLALLESYGDPGVRSMYDIDVLVPRAALATAESALMRAGFCGGPRTDVEERAAWSQHITPLERNGTQLELHWTIERPSSPFRIDLEGLWSRARTIEAAGLRMRVLAAEDLIVHLCLHVAYHHCFERAVLRSLCDLAAIVEHHARSVDWSLVSRLARESRAERFVRCTLILARDLLSTPIPELPDLEREDGDVEIVQAVTNAIVTPPARLPAAYHELTHRRGLRARLELMVETLFPGRAVIASLHQLPARSRWWLVYAAIRPLDLLVRRGRVAARLLFRSRALRPTLLREQSRRRIHEWVEEADRGGPACAEGSVGSAP